MTLNALALALTWFLPLDVVPPPSEQFGFLPIMLLALLAVVLLVGAVVFSRFRRKGRK